MLRYKVCLKSFFRYDFTPTPEEKKAIRLLFGDMNIKEDSFVQTAPVYEPNSPRGVPTEPVLNPQTVHLCETLGIDDPLQVAMARAGRVMKQSTFTSTDTTPKPKQVATPMKILSLSLPAPVTPSLADQSEEKDIEEKDNTIGTPDNISYVSDSTSILESTPVSTGKKTFKRRNQSLYTPDDDSNGDTSSSVLDAESPSASKLSYRPNPMVHTTDD